MSEHREQLAPHLQKGNHAFAPYLFGELVAPWFWSYPCYYIPLDYCICFYILFNIILDIQVMVFLKDWLLLAIIWSKANLSAARMVRRIWSETTSIYSQGGVPQVYLKPKREGCNRCIGRISWNNKWRWTSKVGNHEAGMEAQASFFVINLKKK